jgi:hypothetical protein
MFEEALPHVSATQFLPFRRSLDALFDARNEVVHAGSSATLVEADCQNYLAAALALIALP